MLTQGELDQWRKTFRALSNSAQYEKAFKLATRLKAQHPDVLDFAYYEAVMTAEDDIGFSPAEIRARYRSAAKKLRALLLRARAMTPAMRNSVRNEYYWFSRQPAKQYRLGIERVRNGDRFAYYSQGVGAAELAKLYALQGRKSLCLRWAHKSESAWRKYFKVRPDWYNSYLFFSAALAYQGRLKEMDAAYAKAARIAGKPKNWQAIQLHRAEVMLTREALARNSTRKRDLR